MSHCTKFKFQYTDKGCIQKTFEKLGLSWTNTQIRSIDNLKWRIDEYPTYQTNLPINSALAAKMQGFNIFLENKGNHYELSIEKHSMNANERMRANDIAQEFQKGYVQQVAQLMISKMENKGHSCLLSETDEGFEISFGQMYDKHISVKLENGRVSEMVQGVKGQNCVSLTEALENLLSSPDVELNTEWTNEYYDSPDGKLEIYNLDY